MLYFSAVSLFAQLSVYGADAATRAGVQTLHRDLTDADLVIIDDLGTELTKSFTSMELFTILNERLLAEKATIISSNLELEEVRSRYSDRIFSRICSGFVMHKLTGEDIRLQKIRNLSQNTATP